MRAPVSRRRGCKPALAPITMDLLGMKPDGQLYLWQAASKVQPMDRFPITEDGRIVSGHYVLQMHGCAITAHVANGLKVGDLVVQVMCNGLDQRAVTLRAIEGDVLGRVIPDPKAEAEILDMLRRMTAEAHARQTAPHRKRGQA